MFHGPVRAKDFGLGSATVKLSFAAWKEGAVAPATGTIRLVKDDSE
jgi:hypothetical protein